MTAAVSPNPRGASSGGVLRARRQPVDVDVRLAHQADFRVAHQADVRVTNKADFSVAHQAGSSEL